MTVSEAKRLRALEEESQKLKQIVVDLTLDNLALKEIGLTPAEFVRLEQEKCLSYQL